MKTVRKIIEIDGATVLSMEAPCCLALPMMISKAIEASGRQVPCEEIVIDAKGNIIQRNRTAA